MSDYTPGLWHTRLDEDGRSEVVSADDYTIATCCRYVAGDETGERAARMVAAAPDLARELNHAASLLAALVADRVSTVDFEGERFDLLSEAERFDALLAKVAP